MTQRPESKNPRISEVLQVAFEAYSRSRRGPVPARVVSFAPPATCDCSPVLLDADDAAPLILRSVPLLYPCGSAGGVHWPLVPGDVVYLVPSERAIGEWIAGAADGQLPTSTRRFSVADVVAIPSIQQRTAPLAATAYDGTSTVVSGTVVKLGDSSAVAAVASGTASDANNTALSTWIAGVQAAFAGLGISLPPVPVFATESLTRVKGV